MDQIHWRPDSWREHETLQTPVYSDPDNLRTNEAWLKAAPGLIGFAEIDRLASDLRGVAEGRALVVQGGDCAETFRDFNEDHVSGTVDLLGALADDLEAATGVKVHALARLAGQYGKPRSKATETIDRIELPSYYGDIVNDPRFDASSRAPDCERMRTAYLYAAATLNRLHSNEISACTASSRPIYASHEALLLNYEEALVRRAPDGRSYLTSGHFVWVGERTRGIDEGHVEFLRGLENPIGVKIGPSTDPETLLGLMNVLDPERIPGHLTLIARLGADKVAEVLPPLLDAALADGRKLVWMSDPMHGNTEALPGGRKTRRLERLVDEARTYLPIHRERGSWPGGFHLEMTGEAVCECVGAGVTAADVETSDRYLTACDPRLNADQVGAFVRALRGDIEAASVAGSFRARTAA